MISHGAEVHGEGVSTQILADGDEASYVVGQIVDRGCSELHTSCSYLSYSNSRHAGSIRLFWSVLELILVKQEFAAMEIP